eukprot:1157910-Pelagomonas_calceolata.AAC.6
MSTKGKKAACFLQQAEIMHFSRRSISVDGTFNVQDLDGDWGRQLWACAPGTALQDGTRLCHQDDFQGYVHQGRPETLVQHGEATSKLQRGHPLPFLSIYMEVQHAFD